MSRAIGRTGRFRAVRRATLAWREGRPHEGMEILTQAGFSRPEIDEWVRACQREARRRYRRIMERTA